MRESLAIAFLPDIRTDPWFRGGFETRPYVRLSRSMAILRRNEVPGMAYQGPPAALARRTIRPSVRGSTGSPPRKASMTMSEIRRPVMTWFSMSMSMV
jgi:hypothetical protein